MEDSNIIELYFQRKEEAVQQTQKKYGRLCENVARNILTDGRDLEECVSDTFLHAWNAIPPEQPRSLPAYLARITRNLALDRYAYNRAAQRSTALTDAFEELEGCIGNLRESPAQAAEAQEFRQFINRFLRSQSAQARSFFLRRYWYGEGVGEIAQACGVTEAKIKSSLFRTRSKLREAMQKEEISI